MSSRFSKQVSPSSVHRIVTTLMEGMAFGNTEEDLWDRAPEREPVQRLQGKVRTRGVESATRSHQRRNKIAVTTYTSFQDGIDH